MPCKHPASQNPLQCENKPSEPDHVWPEEGHLVIERCEVYCWFCFKKKGKTNKWKWAWYLRRHVENVHMGRTHPNLTCSLGWKTSLDGNKKPWRETGSPPPMGKTSSPSSKSTPSPKTLRMPKTPARQQKRTALKKKYNEKMRTPSPASNMSSSIPTPSISNLTINTCITPPLLRGPLPKGITLTPRTQAMYNQVNFGTSGGFGNNALNPASTAMATGTGPSMTTAQGTGLAITYGNAVTAPQGNNHVNKFNIGTTATADDPGKAFYAFLERMKANPADFVTVVPQNQNVNDESSFNYNPDMAAPQANMITTSFDDHMNTSTEAASYKSSPYFLDNNNGGVHTTSHDNCAGINGAGAMINTAMVNQQSATSHSANISAPGIGSDMFETDEAMFNGSLSPLDFSAWDQFINMEPSGGTYMSSPADNSASSGSATLNNGTAPTGTVGPSTTSATISPAAIANLSLAGSNSNSPAASTTPSPDASTTSSAPTAAATSPATTITETAGRTQGSAVRKPIFEHFQIARTDGTTIEPEFFNDTGTSGIVQALNDLVQQARGGSVSDEGILFVLQEYVRMYKHGECF